MLLFLFSGSKREPPLHKALGRSSEVSSHPALIAYPLPFAMWLNNHSRSSWIGYRGAAVAVGAAQVEVGVPVMMIG